MTNPTGPHSTGQAHPTPSAIPRAAGLTSTARPVASQPHLPAALADVALIDASAAAAAGSMSVSWWHEAVAAGRAPAPVIRAPRCTRWRMADVASFWRDFGSQSDSSAAAAVKAQATKASAAARSKRRSAVSGTARVEA